MASLEGEGITRAILWPGAGVGGHCLTKDTYHLERGVQVLGGELDFPYTLARGINDFMPGHMLRLTESALREVGKSLKGSKIALLGWAFINDSDDARNTPAEPFRDAALAAGAKVRVHDPWVDPVTSPDAPPGLSRDIEGVLAGADAVVVFAGHKEYRGMVPAQVEGDDRGELQGDGPDPFVVSSLMKSTHQGVVLAIPDDGRDRLVVGAGLPDTSEGIVLDDGGKRRYIGDRDGEVPNRRFVHGSLHEVCHDWLSFCQYAPGNMTDNYRVGGRGD